MRNLTEAHQLWVATFRPNTNLSDLKAAVKDGGQLGPGSIGLRSICWKAFLLFGNLDLSTWLKPLEDSRSAYGSLREHFLRDIRHADDISEVDPLADDETSPWNVLRRDEINRAEIFQDIERCMPENSYFREPTTQAMMLDILFIFCKLNADIGYRQGMHEVLAVVLWVVSRDAIDPESVKRVIPTEEQMGGLFQVALDATYIEHDAFTLFCIIMQSVKSFYEAGGGGSQSDSPIVERSKRIHEDYLYQVDSELAEHLTAIEVLPQIFVIRWIRLLFGREFPLEDVLCLWDALFAEDTTLSLIDLICVAMLLRIRWQLLSADYSSALTLLLRYPVPEAPHNPSTFVNDARLLRQDLSRSTGDHLIFKYSNRSPETSKAESNHPSTKVLRLPKKSTHLRSSSQDSRSDSPRRSPARFLQEQGGIEGVLSEAAKGVYSRGEKWGVNKAFRDAVSGLQSGTNSPRRALDGSRWSLDEGKNVADDAKRLAARVKALEERNRALGKMLNTAMEDLWKQQKQFEQKKLEMETNALNVAIAKVQFVQVYLEDSSIPLFSDHGTERTEPEVAQDPETQLPDVKGAIGNGRSSPSASNSQKQKIVTDKTTNPPITPTIVEPDQPPSPSTAKTLPGSTKPPTADKLPLTTSPSPTQSVSTTNSSAKSLSAITGPASNIGPSPFSHPRPSLAQSSFSWMLKDSDESDTPSAEIATRPKSSFVSALPFPPTKPPQETKKKKNTPGSARAKAGFLFGDDKGDGPLGAEGKRGEGKKGEEAVLGEDGEEGEGFGMGTLRGARPGRIRGEEM